MLLTSQMFDTRRTQEISPYFRVPYDEAGYLCAAMKDVDTGEVYQVFYWNTDPTPKVDFMVGPTGYIHEAYAAQRMFAGRWLMEVADGYEMEMLPLEGEIQLSPEDLELLRSRIAAPR